MPRLDGLDDLPEVTLDEVFGQGPGVSPLPRGPHPDEVAVTVIRQLTQSDLYVIDENVKTLPAPTVSKITSAHHAIAQLIAQSKSVIEVAAFTGYSTKHIYELKKDPAFQELVDFYLNQRKVIFADVMERMKTLGHLTIDELQARLMDDPEGWSTEELMKLANLTVVKPAAATARGNVGLTQGSPVAINISFVGNKGPGPGRGGIIDVDAIEK